MVGEESRPWRPLQLGEASHLLAGAPFFWAIAGGVAIDLAVGHPVREHSDLDVLVLHAEHLAVGSWMAAWECWAADPPGSLRPWKVGEALPPSVHDVWCREDAQQEWRLQFMFDGGEGSTWTSRRDAKLRMPLTDVAWHTPEGVPFLAPHLPLFYKAKNPRPKDEQDLDAVLRSGAELRLEWLMKAIARTYGGAHPWLERLQDERQQRLRE